MHRAQSKTCLVVHFGYNHDEIHPGLQPTHAVRVQRDRIGRQPPPIVFLGCRKHSAPAAEVLGGTKVAVKVNPHLRVEKV